MLRKSCQVLHCDCGGIYLTQGQYLGKKIACPECGRTPRIERLQLTSASSETICDRSNLITAQSSSSNFLKRGIALTAVTAISVLGIVVSLSRTQPQQAPLATEAMPVNSTLEPSPSRSPVSLANGTNIIPPQDLQGRGQLKIVNGTKYDAAVKLVDSVSGKIHRFVYIQANQELTLKNISPCSCILKFTQGTDWDSTTQKFLQNRSFSQFSNPLDFKEIQKETGVEWMEYRVTLHAVPHGKARTARIDESDFEAN